MTQKPTNHTHCKNAAITIQHLSSPSSLCDIGLRPLYIESVHSHAYVLYKKCFSFNFREFRVHDLDIV